jgi:hypothetical protein
MRPRELKLHPMTVRKLLRLRKEAEEDGAYRVARRIHAVILNHDATPADRLRRCSRPRGRGLASG